MSREMKEFLKGLCSILALIIVSAAIIRAIEPKDYMQLEAWQDTVFVGNLQMATVTSEPDTPVRGAGDGWMNFYVNRNGDTLAGDTMDILIKSRDSNGDQEKRKLVNHQAHLAFEFGPGGDTETYNGSDFPDTPANSQAYAWVLSDTPLGPNNSPAASYTAQLGDVMVTSADTDGTVSTIVLGNTF